MLSENLSSHDYDEIMKVLLKSYQGISVLVINVLRILLLRCNDVVNKMSSEKSMYSRGW